VESEGAGTAVGIGILERNTHRSVSRPNLHDEREITMRKTQEHDHDQSLAKASASMLNAVIAEQVLHGLGEPGHLFKVQVYPLWGQCYRVNVLVGPNAVEARVANSYFLLTDGDGNITQCSPKLTRQY